MANSTAVSPWIIDTATAVFLSTKRITVAAFRWDGGTMASGNTVVVKDNGGNVVWDAITTGTAGAAMSIINNPMVFAESGFTFDGLQVPTLATGKLYIYVKYQGS